MADGLLIDDFLTQLNPEIVLLDVRSESEFNQGHIPGAINLPLLNDAHRAEVGITYKKKGREEAVLKGFDLVGAKFGEFVRSVTTLAPGKNVMLYCWRGGMRSNIMAWILNTAGFKVGLLKGGYKSFRRWALHQFFQSRKMVIIGGRTGSGKTDLIKELRQQGEQVINLEGLAHHKGSAFGGLGEQPQPRSEYFENKLAIEWNRSDPQKILWLENESITIGSVKIPDPVFEMMRSAPVIEIKVDMESRVKNILDVYGNFPVEVLATTTQKLKKRLGDLRTRQAVEALKENDRIKWLEEILYYYDKTYDYGMSLRKPGTVFSIEMEKNESIAKAAGKILQAATAAV